MASPSTKDVNRVTLQAFLRPAGSDSPSLSNLSRNCLPPFFDFALQLISQFHWYNIQHRLKFTSEELLQEVRHSDIPEEIAAFELRQLLPWNQIPLKQLCVIGFKFWDTYFVLWCGGQQRQASRNGAEDIWRSHIQHSWILGTPVTWPQSSTHQLLLDGEPNLWGHESMSCGCLLLLQLMMKA